MPAVSGDTSDPAEEAREPGVLSRVVTLHPIHKHIVQLNLRVLLGKQRECVWRRG